MALRQAVLLAVVLAALLPGRHCSRLLPQGCVQQEGRHTFHHQRPLLLQPGTGDQRGRRRRRARGCREGRALPRVAGPVAQLGPELAEQHAPGRAGPVLPRHHQRRPLRALQQRRPPRLVFRPDFQRCPVQLNTPPPFMQRRRSGTSTSCSVHPDWSLPRGAMVL
ncbi:alpha expansin2 [Zea mays]|uniref:Alpha expansin2 n=1 Tax=Zea mays TaxID=4577 RepID=A0A1D6HK99_MAIZE|nr:alpha expansin2 [Zea mays]